MQFEDDETRAKLAGILDLLGVDHISGVLGADLEEVRSMRDGTLEITSGAESLINSEVIRLEAAGLRVVVPETPEPEEIESDDAVEEETAGTTVPEEAPDSPERAKLLLKATVEAIRERLFARMAFASLSEADYALAEVLKCRLDLQLLFRSPFGRNESGLQRRKSTDDIKRRLRSAEGNVQQPGRWRLRQDPTFDATGGLLYQQMVVEYSQSRNMEFAFALGVGIQGIGRCLYPEWLGTSAYSLMRLSHSERLAGEAYVDAISLAEEVKFRSPLPCEEELAASFINLYMEVAMMIHLGIGPPLYDTSNSLLAYVNMPEARAEKRRFLETRRRRLEHFHRESHNCRRFGGINSVADFFKQLIVESKAEHLEKLVPIMNLNMNWLCTAFLDGEDVRGVFGVPDLPPISDS